jgi:hypothetical protein
LGERKRRREKRAEERRVGLIKIFFDRGLLILIIIAEIVNSVGTLNYAPSCILTTRKGSFSCGPSVASAEYLVGDCMLPINPDG